MKKHLPILLSLAALCAHGAAGREQPDTAQARLSYRVEALGVAGGGEYAPLWLTANRYGLSGVDNKFASLRAGVTYRQPLRRNWRVEAGLELAGAWHESAPFVVQQAYADVAWRKLRLSIGSKERPGFPLDKPERLSSGMMVEGPGARPIPQVRAEISDYVPFPGTHRWLWLKGHLAYGWQTDGRWQADFAKPGTNYTKGALYHSKSLMFKIGDHEQFPLEFEFGILMAAQFGGEQYERGENGAPDRLTFDMPEGLKNYWHAFFPTVGGSDTPMGDQVNIEGNQMGSWNFALSWTADDWRVRAYLEHYFEDHSQMFWEYGRWKDGQIGIQVGLPENPFVTTILWEGLNTKDQSGPLLYDGYASQFPEYQISACDNYYNHFYYGGWAHWGQAMGNPLLVGPAYNRDGDLYFKSNRVRANHLGLCGQPTDEWQWRVLMSMARYWGTYGRPLDRQRKQFSSLFEATYEPAWAPGWKATAALGFDRGNYLGNNTGFMLSISKQGILLK